MKKKLLALLLAFVMVAGMLPMAALAEEVEGSSPATALPEAAEGKITLTSDVTLGESKTVENAEIVPAGYTIAVPSGVTLTLNNVKMKHTWASNHGMGPNTEEQPYFIVVQKGGKLVINGGEYESNLPRMIIVRGEAKIQEATFTCKIGSDTSFDSQPVIDVANDPKEAEATGAKLTMPSGTITVEAAEGSQDCAPCCMSVFYGGEVVLGDETTHEGPTFNGGFFTIAFNFTQAPVKVTIHGGTYTSQYYAAASNGLYNSVLYMSAAGTYNITGGKFTAYSGTLAENIKNAVLTMPYESAAIKLNISGGEFTGGTSNITVTGNTDQKTIAVTGGTFNTELNENFISEGYTAVTGEGEDSKWTVKKVLTPTDFTFTAPELTYDGNAKNATFGYANDITEEEAGAISVKYYKGGQEVTEHKDVGEYTVKVTTAGGTKYAPTATELTADTWKFSITQAVGTVTPADETVNLNVGDTKVFTFTTDGEVTATSIDKTKATATVDNTEKTVTIKGVSAGSTSVTISAAEGTNYTAVAEKTITVTVTDTTPAGFDVTFDANGGKWADGTSDPKKFTTDSAGKLAAANIPATTREGYTFASWNTKADGMGKTKDPASDTFTGVTTLYAQWTKNEPTPPTPPASTDVKVTFDANGGKWTDGTEKVVTVSDSKLTADKMPEDPTFEDHSFNGWYTERENGKEVTVTANNPYIVKQDTTLFAQWTPNDPTPPTPAGYTVTFDLNYDGATGAPKAAVTTDGKLAELPAPTREGYTFSGWFTEAEGGEQVTLEKVYSGNTTLYAHWTQNSTGGDTPSTPDYSGGGSSSTTTTTTKNEDGSTTTKTENKATGTVTETTKKPDGSTTVVETKKDGTVTTTEKDAEGNKSEQVVKPDGSSQTKIEKKDGSTSTTTVDTEGQVKAEVTLSGKALETGDKAPVALPMPQVPVTTERETAPTVTVSLPAGTGSAKVEIPVENVTPGSVAIIVKADGTEEIIKTSVTTENGIAVTLNDGDTVKIVDNSKTFADVEDHWGSDAVSFASSRELFNGTSETTFSPDTDMTRGMLVTVLARFDGADTTGGSAWYDKGVEWAVANNVSDGSNPEAEITREQMVTMIWRYAGSPAVTGSALGGFADTDSVSSYAADAMNWAVSIGLINGMGDNSLAPQGTATRAQVATVLMRYVELLAAQ